MPVLVGTKAPSGAIDSSGSTDTTPVVRVEVCPHPFSTLRQTHYLSPQASVIELLESLDLQPRSCDQYAVCIDGVPVPEAEWEWLAPVSDSVVTIRCIPRGGGDKNIGLIIAGVLLLIVGTALYWTPAAAGAPYVQAIGFSLLTAGIGGLIAPGPPKTPSGQPLDPIIPFITGSQNKANPFGAIPRNLGHIRIYPPLGAVPYTEVYNNDQYLRMLFVIGYGPMEISEVRIGDTPIADYADIEWDSLEGRPADGSPVYYTQDIQEDTFNILLIDADSWQLRTTVVDTEEIIIDIVFPAGLIYIQDDGDRKNAHVTIEAEYSIKDAGSWTDFSPGRIAGRTGGTIRKSFKVSVAQNQYDVRVRRVGVATSANTSDEARWTTLRSVKLQSPVDTTKDLAMISIRIRATNQLNGVINQLNCMVKSYVQVTNNGIVWVEEISNNPAWCMVAVLTDAANSKAITTSRLDVASVKDWADWCSLNGFTYNRSIDTKRTVFELIREITAAGRATFHMKDELYSVVRDIAQTVPVQHITPRNSWGYTGSKLFSGGIHAARIDFANEDSDFLQEELLVYADGYSDINATIIEKLSLAGVTNHDQAWKLGRYHIAQLILRPEVHTLTMDIESLVCSRGDLVEFVHDVVKFGLGQARITSVAFREDGACAGVVFDDEWTHEAGKLYSVRIRNRNGDSILQNVKTILAENQGVTFDPAIAELGELHPMAGDLILFGERDEVGVRMLVKSIDPQADLTAVLTLVDEAPAVLTADSGTIPSFNTHITQPAELLKFVPPVPVIVSLTSNEAIMDRGPDGTLRSRLGVSLFIGGNTRYLGSYFFQVQFRLNNTDDLWIIIPLVPIDQSMVIIDQVEDGMQYEVRARTTDGVNKHSEWSAPVSHTIVGKTSAPPDVTNLFVERQSDGTRVFSWTLNSPPPDIAGFVLRYQIGPSGAWTSGSALHTSVIKASPFETNQLAAGQYTFMIKAVDTSGNESANALFVVSTIGDPRLAGALVQVSPRAEGWPGTKTNCAVDPSGPLLAIGTVTWGDFAYDVIRSSDPWSLGVVESTGTIVPTSP